MSRSIIDSNAVSAGKFLRAGARPVAVDANTLLWFSVYIAALLFDRDLWVVSPYGRVESLCLLLILSLLVSMPAVRAFVAGLPRAQRAFCAVAIGALLACCWSPCSRSSPLLPFLPPLPPIVPARARPA